MISVHVKIQFAFLVTWMNMYNCIWTSASIDSGLNGVLVLIFKQEPTCPVVKCEVKGIK